MPGRLGIAKQGLAIVLLLLAVELFFVGYIAVLLQDARDKLAKERHVVAVISGASNIANMTQKLGVALAYSAFSKRLKDMIGSKNDVQVQKNHIDAEFENLKKLVADDPEALKLLDEQQRMIDDTVKRYTQNVDAAMDRPRLEKEGFEARFLEISSDISRKFEAFVSRYKSIQESTPEEVADSIARLKQMMILGAVLNLIAGLLLSYLFVKRVSSRIDKLADSMTKFQTNKEPPELPDERIDDEISQLEIQFKQLIDSLSQAARAEEALVQDAVDVICTMDENGNFTEINNACFKQWGYLKEEIVGRSFELVVSRDDVPNVRKQLERLKDKSAFISFETGIERIDSSRMDASWSCFLSAESKSIFCFIRDISELNNMTETLKSRAEQVRSMMENIPVGVLVVDDKGIVKSANHEIESLIGCESGAVIQTSIAGLIERPTDGSSIATLKKADGERIPTEVTEIPLVMVGKLENLVVVDDIRERIRFENMKKDFVALLRENLRTPLLKVQEMVGTEDSTAETKQSNQIKRITSNTDRLLRLIEELLTIETFSPGKLIGELKPVPTAEILNTAVEALADYAAKQGVSIRVEPLESEVLGDRDRLIQVVINLLSNAIKFSPAKSEVVLKATPKNNTIEFSITDSGRGVPAELEEAIFKPYTQTSASDSEKGTGLGLPICKAIIDSHNGSIGVESASGGGSKFWFRIPGVL